MPNQDWKNRDSLTKSMGLSAHPHQNKMSQGKRNSKCSERVPKVQLPS